MDLVIYKEDEVIIVDFKTDAVDNEKKLIDLYAIQLQTYKSHEKTNKCTNKYVYLCFFFIKVHLFRITYVTMVKSLKKREGERIVEKIL